MSARASIWVENTSPYRDPSQRSVYYVHRELARIAQEKHDLRIWLRQSRLASKLCMARETVNRGIARLVADGLLEVVEDRRDDGQPNIYRLVLPNPDRGPDHRGVTSDHTMNGDDQDSGLSEKAAAGSSRVSRAAEQPASDSRDPPPGQAWSERCPSSLCRSEEQAPRGLLPESQLHRLAQEFGWAVAQAADVEVQWRQEWPERVVEARDPVALAYSLCRAYRENPAEMRAHFDRRDGVRCRYGYHEAGADP